VLRCRSTGVVYIDYLSAASLNNEATPTGSSESFNPCIGGHVLIWRKNFDLTVVTWLPGRGQAICTVELVVRDLTS
jgi:hypothetical protein